MEQDFFGQVNATLPADLQMRVGIPEPSGRLGGSAFDGGYPIMVSAQAFWEPAKGEFRVPRYASITEADLALDSAGFTAMKLWKGRGKQPGMAGIYPWSLDQYLELVMTLSPTWYSQADLCCETEIASSAEEVDFRVRATATLLEGTLRGVYEWQSELAKDCGERAAANLLPPPVPVLQGWTIDDYLRSLDLLVAVWERWMPWLSWPRLIGVGSVCRRHLDHPRHGLWAVLGALEGRLPPGSRLHLFGVKGAALEKLRLMPMVASSDSMAWDFGSRVTAHREGRPNSIASRTQGMHAWMERAHQRLMPKLNDQFRLF